MKNKSKTRFIHVFVLAALMLTLAGTAQAQVKFGQNSTTINANSLLELESTNKGLLLPRVALSATNSASPLSAHIAGMVVYNTATAGTAPNNVTPGYYYNDGAKWNRIATSPDILLPNVPITSSTAPTGITVGQVVYNTTNVSGPPAIPVGPTYWDGTNWVPLSGDPLIGNEVTNGTTNMGLARTGSGTVSSPYTLGLTSGTANNQTMVWNGTSWTPGPVGLVSNSLTSNTSPAGTSTGQLYYNTNAASGVPVGPVYWDGTQWVPVSADPLIGNEVTNGTTDMGLTRSGSGTVSSPYTLGLTSGTANNQTMVWDGSKWIVGSVGLVSTNITSITTPAGRSVGDMIFNTNSSVGPVGPTYWDGTKWVPVAGNDWTTSGNSVNGGNFLGTTNNASLRLRTNNAQQMILDSNGRVGIGTNTPSSTLQVVGNVGVGASAGTVNNAIFPANNPTAHSSSTVPSTLTFGQTGGANVAYNAVRNGSNSFNNEYLTFSTHEGGVSLGERMRITPSGNVGVGTTNPTSKFEVNGSATNTTAFNAGSGTAINFANSNLAYTTANAGAFTLTGMKDGGTYTLAVQGATAGTSSFTHSGLTFRQVNNAATTASKHTLYTFIVMGTTVYYWMNGGL